MAPLRRQIRGLDNPGVGNLGFVVELLDQLLDFLDPILNSLLEDVENLVGRFHIPEQDVVVEGGGGVVIDPSPVAGGGLEARLAAVEQSVAALTHFIGVDLRPDLGFGALARESDIYGQADSAKQNKDLADVKGSKENLAEG